MEESRTNEEDDPHGTCFVHLRVGVTAEVALKQQKKTESWTVFIREVKQEASAVLETQRIYTRKEKRGREGG